MTGTFRLTLAQLAAVPGEIEANAARARRAWAAARAAGADMVALGELFVTGGPVPDRIARPAFVAAAEAAVAALARDCAEGPAIGIGAPVAEAGRVHNGYWICAGGDIRARVLQHEPPRGTGFDPGPISGPVRVGPLRIGVAIGADGCREDVAEAVAESGADMLLVPCTATYRRGGFDRRQAHMVARAVETRLPLACLGRVGGQAGRVCEGGSFVLGADGRLARQLPVFDEACGHVDLAEEANGWRADMGELARRPEAAEQDHRAMVEALRGHAAAAGAVVALPGGIGAVLALAVAVDALGPDRVRGLTFAPAGAPDVAAAALGCRIDRVAPGAAGAALARTLPPLSERGAAAIGARLPGLALAALAEDGDAVPVWGVDRSALALGAAAAQGYNPVIDLSRGRVIEICRWRNAHHRDWMRGPAGAVIAPEAVAAEAAAAPGPGLPPWPELDAILEALQEHGRSVAELVAAGHDRAAVERIAARVAAAERTGRPVPPGPRLT